MNLLVGVSIVSVAVALVYMCFVSSERSGWRELARRYRKRGRFRGPRLRWRSAMLNDFAFHRTLHLGVGPDGLFLVPVLPVRPFHPPLEVPWVELRSRPFERTYSRGLELASIRSPAAGDGSGEDEAELRLELAEDLVRELVSLLDPSWPAARAV
ncbi:MAG: hypothetical protein MI919_12255, partial [Holophagales bacterium]|nr:hypothetical protein [Holophagales bacterium]